MDTESAVKRGLRMVEEGADIIDVGGESTRPGSRAVDEDEEKRRIMPVIEKLASLSDAVISVDTVKPGVARQAVESGARMINDVSNLRDGTGLAEVAAAAGVDLVLMHSRGTPQDMQRMVDYRDVMREVRDELTRSVAVAESAGVDPTRIWLDPGIGFAKTADQCVELIARLSELVELGHPVVVGPSRKSFIGKIGGGEVGERLGGTAAAVTAAIMNGAAAIRVHDVGVMRQAALIARAIASGPGRAGEVESRGLMREANA